MTAPLEWSQRCPAQAVYFGPNALGGIAEIVRSMGARRVLVVMTERGRASEAGQRLVGDLGRNVAAVFQGVKSLVPITAVQGAVQLARAERIDGLVSFGGGSCADLAKAVAWFIEREMGTPGATYLDRPVTPHVCIPTTYAGAALSSWFTMSDAASRRTSGGEGPTLAPVAAVYDPVLTLDTPTRVTAETGMTALAHAIEAACSPARTPEAEALALQSIRLIAGSLGDVVDDPFDIDARTRLLSGAVLAARSMTNAPVGALHGLAELLSARADIAHGLACALLLAPVMRFNGDSVGAELAAVGEALGDPSGAAGAVDRLRGRVGLPAGLIEAGVTIADIDAVARMTPGNRHVAANPRPVDEDDARSIIAGGFSP